MNIETIKVFIPIKEKSAGFEERNFSIFDGVPLWRRFLRKFSNFKLFVDTDCQNLIQEISKDRELDNVTVYMRNPDLTGNEVNVCDLVADFLERFRIYHEPVVQTYVTCPFLDPFSLESAVQKVSIDSQYDSAISCSSVRARAWRTDAGFICPVNHNPLNYKATSTVEPLLLENSLFYIFQAQIFRRTGNRIGFNPWFQDVHFPENMKIITREDLCAAHIINDALKGGVEFPSEGFGFK